MPVGGGAAQSELKLWELECRQRHRCALDNRPPPPLAVCCSWALPVQLAISLAHVRHAPAFCATAPLQSPATQHLLQGAYAMLDVLTSALVPFGRTLLGQPPAQKQCATVLAHVQLALGLAAPALVQAVIEVRLFMEHQLQRAEAGLPLETGPHARLYTWIRRGMMCGPGEVRVVLLTWVWLCILFHISTLLVK